MEHENLGQRFTRGGEKELEELIDLYGERLLRYATAASLMLVVTVAAATLGGFDWFMEKVNPHFGVIIEPVEIYSEDQGIRMEVICAQKYENKAIRWD